MAEVVGLHGYDPPISQAEINNNIVEKLEHLLERAKSGNLTSIAFCYCDNLGMSANGWECGNEAFKLGGAVLGLQHRYSKAIWPD